MSTSFIIPTRNETYLTETGETVLQRTVRDIYDKAEGEFEVVVCFDGPPYQSFPSFPRLKVLELPETIGLKKCLNMLAEVASCDNLLKLDSHCMVSEGINRVLESSMRYDWLVTPRFYVLDAENWKWQDNRFYDYFYLSCPFTDPRGFRFKAGGHWPERTAERLYTRLDETPQIHGSCWFINRIHYLDDIGGFPTDDPFGHAQEPPYLGLKTWLGPWYGKVMVNKDAWYAHMHKGGQRPRGYTMTRSQENFTYNAVASYWMGNHWEGRAKDIDWFISKFYPMPTWEEDWRSKLKDWQRRERVYGA